MEVLSIVILCSVIILFGTLLFFNLRIKEVNTEYSKFIVKLNFYIDLIFEIEVEKEVLTRSIIKQKTISDKDFNELNKNLIKSIINIIPNNLSKEFESIFSNNKTGDLVLLITKLTRIKLFSYLLKNKIGVE